MVVVMVCHLTFLLPSSAGAARLSTSPHLCQFSVALVCHFFDSYLPASLREVHVALHL